MAAVLTNRELEVVRLAATGMRNREIAATLDITLETVKAHMKHVLSKLGARDRAEASSMNDSRENLLRRC